MDLMDLDPIPETTTLYQPLRENEIRLLVLPPGDPEAPVDCHLVTFPLDSAPVYDGISYVWGDAGDVCPVCCDGFSTSITRNLHWALGKIRRPGRPRVVWADALCINQRDSRERSMQVALMGRIYSGARTVFACMGEDPTGGAPHVASLLNDYGPLLNGRPPGLSGMLRLWRGTAVDVVRWRHLGALMRAPWFRRAWVLQEVGLARDPRVLYGAAEFSYRRLIAAVKWARTRGEEFAASVGITSLLIHNQWEDWSEESWRARPASGRHDFLDLLDHAALLDCRDPRDRIYAFLGHPSARGSHEIVPDYTKDTLEVFKEVSALLIRVSGVRALSSVEHSHATINEDFPSWVIRWDTTFILNNISQHPDIQYQANSGSPSATGYINGDVLSAKSIAVDIVEAVWPMRLLSALCDIQFSIGDGSPTCRLDRLVDLLENPQKPCVYHGTRSQRIAHTLCGDSYESAALLPRWKQYLDWYSLPNRPAIPEHALSFWRTMAARCQGRAFIITKKGYYGLAPHVSQPGDLCYVVYGSSVPFIMRPCQSARGRHVRLVGEAYIHGIMRGEAVQMLQDGVLQEELLSIY